MDKSTIFHTLVEVLTPVLVAGLTLLSAWLAKWIARKVKNEYLSGVLVRLDEAVLTAVKHVSQTYVDAIKKARQDGRLEPAERAEARRRALGVVKSYLGSKGLAEMGRVLGIGTGQIDQVLSSRVEAAVHDLKVAKSALAPGGASPLAGLPASS